jgi:hypothetical protein
MQFLKQIDPFIACRQANHQLLADIWALKTIALVPSSTKFSVDSIPYVCIVWYGMKKFCLVLYGME